MPLVQLLFVRILSFPRHPDQYQTWKATSESEHIEDALAEDPNMVIMWAGYGFAKDYNKARGHYYALDDIRQTLRTGGPTDGTTGPMPMACWSCKSPDVGRVIAERGEDGYFEGKWARLGAEIANPIGCADCHNPENAFTDSNRFSEGVEGVLGNRNSMPLFNLAWNYDNTFFWDGRDFGLENQVFEPITNPIEMHTTWEAVTEKLQQHPEYPELFNAAFGTQTIDSVLVSKAIAQFERTLISANSKFDKFLLGTATLTPEETNGFNIFMDESKGDCFHCHGSDNNPLWTDNKFHNNQQTHLNLISYPVDNFPE